MVTISYHSVKIIIILALFISSIRVFFQNGIFKLLPTIREFPIYIRLRFFYSYFFILEI